MAGLDTFSALDADLLEVLGETVTYTPVDAPGSPVSVKGLFTDPSQPQETFDAPIRAQANTPAILIHTDDISQAKRGDRIARTDHPDGKTYEVDLVERDEGALWRLNLKEV